MRVSQYILAGRKKLAEANIQCADPLEHMKQIVQLALDWNASQLYLKWDDVLPETSVNELDRIVDRRTRGEPFQYIAGYEWFWKSKFEVGPGVLIPRRETELLVETFLSTEDRKTVAVAELGAGSGNIGLSILSERPEVQWHAFEINPQSILYLEANWRSVARKSENYWIHYDDFFNGVREFAPLDWVVANPPYVERNEIASLAAEVLHEPTLALDGGLDGLRIFEQLSTTSWEILGDGGKFLCEIGSGQGDAAASIVGKAGFSDVKVLPDLAGLPRAVFGVKKG